MSDIQVISEAEAGSQIDSILGADEPAAPERPRGTDGKFLPVKPKEPEAAAPEEGEGEDDEPEEKAAEEPEVEQDDDEDTPAQRMLKVKVNGIEEEKPEDEVVRGYSRTADYTQKTQALATEKREFYEKEVAPVRAERQQYAEVLDKMRTAVESLLPETEPDWSVLRQTATPEEFTQAFAEYQGQRQRVDKIKAEQARVTALQTQDASQQRQERLASERQKLMDALPELKDPEKGKGLADDLTAYLVSLGFPEEGIAETEDHRLFVIAEKARRWDESLRRRPKLEEKIDRALDTIKPSSVRSAPKRSETERAKTRLAETGRFEDAASLISKML